MKIIGIIPARMESSRFPNKPLSRILGVPMIGHVYYRSQMCSLLDDIWVATCNQEILEYINNIRGKAIMTANTHERASDRVAEALLSIEKMTDKSYDIVILIQGDEPMIVPEMIEMAVQPLIDDSNIKVSNLMAEMKSIKEFEDPNEVKVVVDNNNYALYFSREPIPSRQKYKHSIPMMKQVCVIPFKRDCLFNYTKLKPTTLEIIESVDMNRLIENGIKVKMVKTDIESYAVDTKEDLLHVSQIMKQDQLVKTYLGKA